MSPVLYVRYFTPKRTNEIIERVRACQEIYAWGTLQFASSDVDTEKEPLICADVVSLIGADLRTEGSVNQRFPLPGKTDWTMTPNRPFYLLAGLGPKLHKLSAST